MIPSGFFPVSSAVFLLAACAGTPAPRASAPGYTGPPVAAMTWNIRIGAGPEGPLKPGTTANLRAIAAAIVEEGADVVLLQEVDRNSARTARTDQLALLGEATGMHTAWAPAIETDAMAYGIGLLSRWPIGSTEVVRLPFVDYAPLNKDIPAYYGEPRVALVARLEGMPVTIINTHLGLTKEQRLAQIEVLTRLAIAEESAGRAVILGGDLNAEPDAPELLPLRAALRDVYHGHTDKWGLEHDLSVRDRLTFPALKPDRCIDFLFLSRDVFTLESVTIPQRPLSDHLPVMARLAGR